MTTTVPDFFSLRNHETQSCVALDREVSQFTHLLVGERESGQVSQLRRDLRRGRNKAVQSVLRIIRDDLHSGKAVNDVAQFSDALSAMIRSHARECQGSLADQIAAKTDIDCVERPLEVKVLRGDDSRGTLTKLARTLRHEEQKIQGCERAVNARLYGI